MQLSDSPQPPPGNWIRDLELVREARGGDPAAVERFLERMTCVRRFHMLKNEQFGRPLGKDELEDAVQETLFALWRKLDHYQGTGPLEAWAYRFAYLRFLERLRKLERRPRLLDDMRGDVPEPVSPPKRDHERFERLYRMLELVGDPDESLIRKKVLEQRTFEELAMQMELPTNTVKTRFYRAMTKLRGLLQSAQDELQASDGGRL